MYEMSNVAKIIALHGGLDALKSRSVHIGTVPGHDRLCIEYAGPAPTPGLEMISVAHYFERNGDLMSDPEMTFEVNPADSGPLSWRTGTWRPQSITQSPTGTYRESVWRGDDGRVMIRPGLIRELKAFARMWNRNIKEQGYIGAYREMRRAAAVVSC